MNWKTVAIIAVVAIVAVAIVMRVPSIRAKIFGA